MPKPFKNLVICHTDDFPENKNDKISGWIEYHGGTFTKNLTSDTTHLIASPKAWKKKSSLVQRARHQRRTKIVSLDWLDDCLMKSKPRKLDTLKYEFEQRKILREAYETKKLVQNTKAGLNVQSSDKTVASTVQNPKDSTGDIIEAGTLFDKACNAKIDDLEIAGYHLVKDSTGFSYAVTLVRKDILHERVQQHLVKVRYASQTSDRIISPTLPLYYFPKPYPFSATPVIEYELSWEHSIENPDCRVYIKNSWAQCLQLYESDQAPHNYHCYYLDLQPGKKKPTAYTLAPAGSTWNFAWNVFKKFFKTRCGMKWGCRTVPENSIEESFDDGFSVNRSFNYQNPDNTEPQGLQDLPADKSPHVTIVLPVEALNGDEIEAWAKTPEEG